MADDHLFPDPAMLVLNLEQLSFRPGATATTQAAPSARAQHYFTSVSYFGAFLNKPVQAIPALHRMSQAWALPSRLNRVPSDVEREVELVSPLKYSCCLHGYCAWEHFLWFLLRLTND